jgi:hypothetical protein
MEDAKQILEAVGALQKLAEHMGKVVPLEKTDVEMNVAIQMVCAYAIQYAHRRQQGMSPRAAIIAIR